MPFARHTLDAFQFCQVSVGFYANLMKYFFVINIWLKLFVVTMVREIVKTRTWKYPSDDLLISDHRNTQQTETKYDLENVEKPLAPLITMLEPPLLEALFPHWSPPCPCHPRSLLVHQPIMSQLPLLEALAPPVRFSSAVSGHLGTDEREGPHAQHHAR